MSDDSTKAPLSSTSSKFKAVVILFWTLCVAAITFLMLASLGGQAPDPGQTIEQHRTAIGMAGIIVTGCAGGGWFCGLLVIAVIAALLRD